MKKALFSFLIFVGLVFFCITLSAQTIETITYYDMQQNRNIIAEAVFGGWYHQYTVIYSPNRSSTKLLTYGSFMFSEELASEIGTISEWSEWELLNSEPSPHANVNLFIKQRDALRLTLISHPKIGIHWTNFQGFDAIRILAAPSNRGEPFWFDNDNNLHTFYHIYFLF